jgi:hypothetical protein
MRIAPRAPLVYLLLLFSLLSLQAEQLHAAAHDDGAECQICLHALQAQKSLHVGATAVPLPLPLTDQVSAAPALSPYRQLPRRYYRSRAPPVYTSFL